MVSVQQPETLPWQGITFTIKLIFRGVNCVCKCCESEIYPWRCCIMWKSHGTVLRVQRIQEGLFPMHSYQVWSGMQWRSLGLKRFCKRHHQTANCLAQILGEVSHGLQMINLPIGEYYGADVLAHLWIVTALCQYHLNIHTFLWSASRLLRVASRKTDNGWLWCRHYHLKLRVRAAARWRRRRVTWLSACLTYVQQVFAILSSHMWGVMFRIYQINILPFHLPQNSARLGVPVILDLAPTSHPVSPIHTKAPSQMSKSIGLLW